jgi:hypothetical protein
MEAVDERENKYANISDKDVTAFIGFHTTHAFREKLRERAKIEARSLNEFIQRALEKQLFESKPEKRLSKSEPENASAVAPHEASANLTSRNFMKSLIDYDLTECQDPEAVYAAPADAGRQRLSGYFDA